MFALLCRSYGADAAGGTRVCFAPSGPPSAAIGRWADWPRFSPRCPRPALDARRRSSSVCECACQRSGMRVRDRPEAIFQRADRYEGVRPINIYILLLLYILMFFVLGKETWTHILTHQGPWNPTDAVAWCVWTAFASLEGIGIISPAKMLPIVLP